jgi:hypothetical protein
MAGIVQRLDNRDTEVSYLLEDGRVIDIYREITGTALVCVSKSQDADGWDQGWQYADILKVVIELVDWATRGFEGEPNGWIREPTTGRRRPDGDASKEYVYR